MTMMWAFEIPGVGLSVGGGGGGLSADEDAQVGVKRRNVRVGLWVGG